LQIVGKLNPISLALENENLHLQPTWPKLSGLGMGSSWGGVTSFLLVKLFEYQCRTGLFFLFSSKVSSVAVMRLELELVVLHLIAE